MAKVNTKAVRFSSLILRTILFLLIWWILTNGNLSSYRVGLPVVVLAVVVSLVLIPVTTINWLALMKFIPYFIGRSLVGGFEVAKCVFNPALPITPALIEYPNRLPQGIPNVFFLKAVSLLPGTLAADSSRDILKLHVLDLDGAFMDELKTVEQRIANIFAVTLNDSKHNKGD